VSEGRNSKPQGQRGGKFGHLDFEIACPVKWALVTSGLMYPDPSQKSKIIDFGQKLLY
jgi:hypothetical protein